MRRCSAPPSRPTSLRRSTLARYAQWSASIRERIVAQAYGHNGHRSPRQLGTGAGGRAVAGSNPVSPIEGLLTAGGRGGPPEESRSSVGLGFRRIEPVATRSWRKLVLRPTA